MSHIDESTLLIFCPAWGEKHLRFLKEMALPSVMQSGNLPACGYEKVIIRGSTMGNPDLFRSILQDGFWKVAQNQDMTVIEWFNEQDALMTALRLTIAECIERRCRMFLMMPDTVIANGSLFNIREYARGNGVSVAGYHVRVDESFCGYFDPSIAFGQFSSKDLVTVASQYPHQTFSSSFTVGDNSTFTGGLALRQINPKTMSLIHYLPTIYLAWFTESDMAFFNRATAFRAWDHDWNPHLVSEGRFRLLGCSELFFAVELTERDRNNCEVRPGSAFEEDSNQSPSFMRSFVGCLHT